MIPLALIISCALGQAGDIEVGFGAIDVTPAVGQDKKPVYLAGFGKNRIAIGVNDPIMARAVVLRKGDDKIALVSVDLVGLFRESILRVRERLSGFRYVLVSSTHNHEGPDTMGLWGPSFFQSGIDTDYLKHVEAGIVASVRQAEKSLEKTQARWGSIRAPELLHDNREPYIKHDELTAIQFLDRTGTRTLGLVVNWHCHPETLDDKNKQVSADFVAATVQHLQDRFSTPVVYFTGTVGGLMTSLHVPLADEKGAKLADGTFEKTRRYGQLVGMKAEEALKNSRGLDLSTWKIRSRSLYLPIENPLYQLGWKLGVLDRKAYFWAGDPLKAEPVLGKDAVGKKLCLETEIALLELGDWSLAAIPGEIYPELVLDKIQDPADPAADFPNAAKEPAIYPALKGPVRMLIGLANDELGYIIPKRQWDENAPFCYGSKKAQYGEVNSLGPETAPILSEQFRRLVQEK